MRQMLNPAGAPEHEAVAYRGVGVFDTLKSVARQLISRLRTA
jgi:mutual gliding-motility protein MglA